MSGVESYVCVEGIDLFGTGWVRVGMARGRVESVEKINPGSSGPVLAPGLVDLQVNGAGGYDLQTAALTDDVVAGLSQRLWAYGVTTYLPTLITNGADQITHAVRVIARAASGSDVEAESIGGIHLEGPFISTEDGPRGAHQNEHVRPPDWELLQRWQDAAGGLIRVITLSPEWPGVCRFIERCVEAGLLVAIGHTAAQPHQIRDAIAAGARLSTHLGNGAHTMLPRHDNYVWEQLASGRLWASLIADGAHLPEALLRVMIRAKGDRALLVSDVTALAGLEPGEYQTPTGRQVRLTDDGRLVLVTDPSLLAGSCQTLLFGVAHLARKQIADLRQAWTMASLRPSRLLKLPQAAGIEPGAPADLVVFDWDGSSLAVRKVYKAGRIVAGSELSSPHVRPQPCVGSTTDGGG